MLQVDFVQDHAEQDSQLPFLDTMFLLMPPKGHSLLPYFPSDILNIMNIMS